MKAALFSKGSLLADVGVLVCGIERLIGDVHITMGTFRKGLRALVYNAEGAFRMLEHEMGSHGLWRRDFPVWTCGNRAGVMTCSMVESDLVSALCRGGVLGVFVLPVYFIDSMLGP